MGCRYQRAIWLLSMYIWLKAAFVVDYQVPSRRAIDMEVLRTPFPDCVRGTPYVEGLIVGFQRKIYKN